MKITIFKSERFEYNEETEQDELVDRKKFCDVYVPRKKKNQTDEQYDKFVQDFVYTFCNKLLDLWVFATFDFTVNGKQTITQ